MYTGKIMWISHRDGNGIILADIDGYTLELYFDTSVFPEFSKASRNDLVTFTPRVLDRVNCAREVSLT